MPFPSLTESFSQLYPSKPKFTEEDIPSLDGKVYIVTGANVGVGKEVTQILYSKNAKVYAAARSEEKANAAIKEIKQAHPDSKGEILFMRLDLADLTTIKASAQQFLDGETKLHVLFNNAGVMNPPQGSKTAQGYDLQLGVNDIGTFMFTKLLTPTLIATAKAEGPGTSRVVWVSSSAAEAPLAPKGGVPLDNLDYHEERSTQTKYSISKAGNWLHGSQFARLHKDDGVASVILNPGNLDSELWRTQGTTMRSVLRTAFLHPPVYGAYTELFAAFSPELTIENTGSWVVPWGRITNIRKDLAAAAKTESEGGLGTAEKFWDWTETQVKPYL